MKTQNVILTFDFRNLAKKLIFQILQLLNNLQPFKQRQKSKPKHQNQ